MVQTAQGLAVRFDNPTYLKMYHELPRALAGKPGYKLDKLRMKDAHRYYKAAGDKELGYWLGCDTGMSLERAKQVVQSVCNGYKVGYATRMCVRDANGKLCGVVSVRRPNAENFPEHQMNSGNIWEIGYWLTKEHRGRGVGTAAVRELLGIIARANGNSSTSVVARCYTDNVASLKLLKQQGFDYCYTQLEKRTGREIGVYIIKLV